MIAATPTQRAARRLRLTQQECDLVFQRCGRAIPPALVGEERSVISRLLDGDSATAPTSVEGTLTRRGVLVESGVSEAVRVNLDVLVDPEVAVRVRASTRAADLVSLHTVAGALGASLVRLSPDLLELSLFDAATFGSELIRIVPDIASRPDRSTVVLPHAALEQIEPALRTGGDALAGLVADGLALDAAQREAAVRLVTSGSGVLDALVLDPRTRSGALRAAVVVWYATGDGWVGVRPGVGDGDPPQVALEPVERADFGTWVAPYVAGALA